MVMSGLNPTIFHEAWWLELASGGLVREASISHDGVVIARLPYLLSRHLGFTTCGMPPFVHFLGPAFVRGTGTPMQEMLREHELTRELLAQLPPFSGFWQKFHHGFSEVLAFQAHGFKTSVQFTFEVPRAASEEVWAGLRRTTRQKLRAAEARFHVREGVDPGEYVALYQRNLKAEGKAPYLDLVRLGKLARVALARGRGRILFADAGGKGAVAGTFYIYGTIIGCTTSPEREYGRRLARPPRRCWPGERSRMQCSAS